MAKQEAQRRHRVGGMDGGGSDLGEERLKDEVVIVVDQLDIEFAAAAPRQLLGGKHATKAAANNENFRLFHGRKHLPLWHLQAYLRR